MSKNPAIEVGKEVAESGNDVFKAPFGAEYTLEAVATPLIQAVSLRIPDPPVPTIYNKDMEREEENPTHPDYIAALEKAEQDRGLAMIDAMVLFGIKIITPPTSDEWVQNLRFMERKGLLDLAGYDFDDPYEKMYIFKKFIIANNDLVSKISKKSGVSPEEIKQQENSFQGNAE